MVPPAARLTFLLLGPPQILWGDAPLPVARRQVRALLYCLAGELRPVSRDRKVSYALRAYAAFATSAAQGAVRDTALLPDRWGRADIREGEE